MSDNYQVLAFDSIEENAAQAIAHQAIGWLIARGCVCEVQSDSAYGPDGLGHRPGSHWREIVDFDEEQCRWAEWSERTGRAVPSAADSFDDFLTLKINGVAASSQRSVHHSGENCRPEPEGVCPTCNVKSAPEVDLGELAERWWRRETCELVCPSCMVTSRLEDWDWQPDWAFAEASLTFWNWPPISAEVISRMSAALGGVRVRRVDGRL